MADETPNESPKEGKSGATSAPVIIKKYANRRLYNTATSAYVTLDHLSEMVRSGVDFTVLDAKTNDDITRSVLTQIIFEEESKQGQNLLPVQFLRRLIRFYGDSMQGFLPAYLEMSMERFSSAQDQWRDQLTKTWVGKGPIGAFEDQAKANMAMFEQAMRLWAPFAAQTPPPPPSAHGEDPDADFGDLKRQMEAMQRQLDQLSGKRKP
ncbi:MAG: polyhydroxyalkonate synthesis repressor PhaR [Alphaproteobacteria bacterium]|nr:MAG: polyhydroxyalkonate synthesis repressor PhaR [Caulobacteraceae bacterium]TPW03886.1 MAG: polyhydroxyalkonate synthesis repressor PhaR [Alphaproteobacteria bacterium]